MTLKIMMIAGKCWSNEAVVWSHTWLSATFDGFHGILKKTEEKIFFILRCSSNIHDQKIFRWYALLESRWPAAISSNFLITSVQSNQSLTFQRTVAASVFSFWSKHHTNQGCGSEELTELHSIIQSNRCIPDIWQNISQFGFPQFYGHKNCVKYFCIHWQEFCWWRIRPPDAFSLVS